nr:YjbH domain-containing protein [Sulfitobacter sp. JL08]
MPCLIPRYVLVLAGVFVLPASGSNAQQMSLFGTPGLIDMPTARTAQDGIIGIGTAQFRNTGRNTLTFQITPRIQGAFHYSTLNGYDADGGTRYDRSFDIHMLLAEETDARPAIALGLRDFGGTGIYSGEYVVATKEISHGISLTGGIGWGRLATRNSFGSPFAFISDSFKTRPKQGSGGGVQTGQPDFDSWFRGDAAFFGGIHWQATDQWSFAAEYSSDAYLDEAAKGVTQQESPFNLSAQYKWGNGVTLGAYYLYGTEAGVSLSYTLDPALPPIPGGIGPAPPAILPQHHVAAASWNMPEAKTGPREHLTRILAQDGLILHRFHVDAKTARIAVANTRFDAGAQAISRTARAMANTLPPHIAIFEITLITQGIEVTKITIDRTNLGALEFSPDAAWQSYARSRIKDAFGADQGDPVPDLYPIFDAGLGGYLEVAFFDPDNPVRIEFGIEAEAEYSPAPGWFLSGRIRQPVAGNLDNATRVSNSELPPVRSDVFRYAQESDLRLSYLTGEHFSRPAKDVFARMTVGYLEPMFGGVSGEILWNPVNSAFAYGAEINYAVQRDFDMQFGFQDYGVVTGHASTYYDFGNGFLGQLDVGRYLAKDWGATFTLDREFKNGFKLGGFVTLTDVPFDTFGEGSFDKGIRLEIPVSWLTGRPSKDTVSQTIRPVYRDGGARLDVRNRLYDVTRDLRQPALANQCGRFWR